MPCLRFVADKKGLQGRLEGQAVALHKVAEISTLDVKLYGKIQ